MEPRFLATVEEKTPTILCEEHAKMFEKIMIMASMPHTIYELDDDDGPYYCHACKLKDTMDEISSPRIILPTDMH